MKSDRPLPFRRRPLRSLLATDDTPWVAEPSCHGDHPSRLVGVTGSLSLDADIRREVTFTGTPRQRLAAEGSLTAEHLRRQRAA